MVKEVCNAYLGVDRTPAKLLSTAEVHTMAADVLTTRCESVMGKFDLMADMKCHQVSTRSPKYPTEWNGRKAHLHL